MWPLHTFAYVLPYRVHGVFPVLAGLAAVRWWWHPLVLLVLLHPGPRRTVRRSRWFRRRRRSGSLQVAVSVCPVIFIVFFNSRCKACCGVCGFTHIKIDVDGLHFCAEQLEFSEFGWHYAAGKGWLSCLRMPTGRLWTLGVKTRALATTLYTCFTYLYKEFARKSFSTLFRSAVVFLIYLFPKYRYMATVKF